MKSFWLNKKNNAKLILFFAGWGMDENPLKHLSIGDYDVLILSDYSDLALGEDLSKYTEITLIAWSMGVLAASIFCQKQNLNLTRAIAINGTQNPVDAKFGIHPKIYQLTLDNLNETTRDKFFGNMFQNETEQQKFQKPAREIKNQHEELAALQKLAAQNPSPDCAFDCAIISTQDKIIPSKNQKNFWQTKKVKVVELSSGHYPFFELNSFEEILDETL